VYSYNIYALNVQSDIDFPILTQCARTENCDLKISLGETLEKLEGEDVLARVKNQSSPREFLITNPIANFHVTNGNKIQVEVKDENEWAFIRHYLLSRCMAIVSCQRGWLPIHGSAIRVRDKAVLFVGNSGVGKSTVASFFVKRGYGFVSDDICVVKKKEEGDFHLFPAYPNIRLWKDAIELVSETSFRIGGNVRRGIEKFNVNHNSSFDSSPLPISHIYFLRISQGKQSYLQSIDKTQALFNLMGFTYSNGQMKGIGSQGAHFFTFSHLLKNIKMKTVYRSPFEQEPEQLISLVEQSFLDNE